MTQILWIDGSDESLTAAEQTKIPVLMFAAFWSKEKRKRVFEEIDRIGIQGFFLEPVGIDIAEEGIVSLYETNRFSVRVVDPATPELLEKILAFEPVDIPAYLWDETLYAGRFEPIWHA